MSTPIKGYQGKLDFGAVIDSDLSYRTHAWSLDVAADTVDVTDFTTEQWREFCAGLKTHSGSAELYVDDTNLLQPSDVGSTATFRCYLNDTHYLTGKGIVNSWNPATTVDGVATQSIGWQGTSDLFFV